MNLVTVHLLLLGFAALITAGSVFGILAPASLARWVSSMWTRPFALPLAVAIRLALGALLLLAAATSRFPMAFTVLGWIALVAALLIPVVGRERIGRLLAWFSGQSPLLVRCWCVFGAAFGLWLGYGVM